MTIQRQYSLPNCKLVLEGVSDESSAGLTAIARPPLVMVMNVECHVAGYEKPLTGGQDFLENLVTAVSNYAQEFLSGVHHPSNNGKQPLVQLQKVEEDLHRLLVYPQTPQDNHAASPQGDPIQLDLKTVQLFDLVEAVDQLCADTLTLPDLALKLTPVAKRYFTSQEPIAKRALPAAIGASGLTVAAALLFLVPVPEVRRPEPAQTGATQESPAAVSPTPASPPSPPDGDSPDAASPSPTISPDPIVSPDSSSSPDSTLSPSPTASPGSTNSPSPIVSPSPTASPSPIDSAQSSGEDLTELLTRAPEITDPEQLRTLTRQLRDALDASWASRPDFDEDLVYRVGVSAEGDILGFRYINDASLNYVNQTPLLDLRYNPTDEVNREPIAQFRVVFTPEGAIEVSPWHGRPPSPESSP